MPIVKANLLVVVVLVVVVARAVLDCGHEYVSDSSAGSPCSLCCCNLVIAAMLILRGEPLRICTYTYAGQL